eukprot:76731-Prymnesium_polylepis.3
MGLRSDIMCSQYALFLTKVPLFAGCKSDVIARLAERLVPHLFLYDELIVRENSPGGEMYFIERGLVRVVKGKSQVQHLCMHPALSLAPSLKSITHYHIASTG